MEVLMMKGILLGAIALGSAVAGLFFLRFWLMTGDRLFLYFSLACFLEGLCRVLMGITPVSSENEEHPVIYLIRLVAYGLIIFAIIDKNRKKSPSLAPPSVSINDRDEFTHH
jgi:hypothetical protein